jgi:transposase-like protein
MRKRGFSEEQMVTILREADRTTVAEAAKKHQVSEPTIYAWRKHFCRHYNEVRPHSSPQYLTPTAFKQQLRQNLQPAVFWELLSRNYRAGHAVSGLLCHLRSIAASLLLAALKRPGLPPHEVPRRARHLTA